MMRRKIVPHGPSSMTISLPYSWVKSNNLKKGEELDVLEEDNNLIIRPISSNDDLKKIDTSFIGIDKSTRKDLILALHEKGYDEIKIAYDNDDTIKELQSLLNDMQLGFEIIKHEYNTIFIRNVTNPDAGQFDNLFRRIFRITIEYSKKIEGILDKKEDITNSSLLHEVSINRISIYCKRIIIKDRRQNAYFLHAIIDELNNITHDVTRILKELKEMEKTYSKKFISKYGEVTDILVEAYHLHYKFSLQDFDTIKKNSETLRKHLEEMTIKDSTDPYYLDALISIHHRIDILLVSTLSLQF